MSLARVKPVWVVGPLEKRILGLGDQGAGGMGIPIGKLSLYTACAGLHPSTTLPILLDVGTDNQELLADPLYIGWRHERARGADYDDFVASFVNAVRARWPHVLLHWEDFAFRNANRLLAQYRERLCSYNDDIQGTAAIAVGAVLSAINVSGVAHRAAHRGAGSGFGGHRHQRAAIARHDRGGPARDGGPQPVLSCRPRRPVGRGHGRPAAVSDALCTKPRPARRLEARLAGSDRSCRRGRQRASDGPHRHIGQPRAFSERIVRAMAAHVERPVIFPLSNPTERSEATPQELIAWTDGRAVIGTGSPFPPIEQDGRPFRIDQTNNSYVYPGVGLAAIAVQTRRISDGMFLAAARTIAELSPAKHDPRANLCRRSRSCERSRSRWRSRSPSKPKPRAWRRSVRIRILSAAVSAKMWEPRYAPYRRQPC